ncbi:MAG: hypothetical protein ACW986_17640 [Promethearchaeota archaeon]|jgi:hypothetical protein
MPLKCQVCGNDYFHDGKVCQTCEETAMNSGLQADQKWRCDNFLELRTLAFGSIELINHSWDDNLGIRLHNLQEEEGKINHFLRFE